ncbi:MAG: thiamine biosynthesis lipoprotein ApbE [Actinomycetia bacterium]|nr:thiamine biosynthesis lipoprotein ApbE [Actinomycetes bacterium]
MGTAAHVVAVGDRAEALLERAALALADLERKWSRFIASSEVSRLNALSGQHVVVSVETLLLVQCALHGWSRTGGLFDPTVLPSLRAAGYDRDFAAVATHASGVGLTPVAPAPGCADIECDERVGTVTLPRGVEFDPGGIGKGLAADLVSADLVDAGARGVLVNVGGDLRVRGEPPNGATWDVAIADPVRTDRELLRVGLVHGSVATSSRMRRRWQNAAGEAHHVIDPRNGRPARTPHATVAAITGEGWWSEVVAKAVLVGGLGTEAGAGFAARLLTVDDDGVVAVEPTLIGAAR